MSSRRKRVSRVSNSCDCAVLHFSPFRGTRYFCHPNRLWGPSNFLFNGCWCSFLWVKRPSRDFGHLPHLMRWIRLSGVIPLLPLYASWHWRWQIHLCRSTVYLKTFMIFKETLPSMSQDSTASSVSVNSSRPLRESSFMLMYPLV